MATRIAGLDIDSSINTFRPANPDRLPSELTGSHKVFPGIISDINALRPLAGKRFHQFLIRDRTWLPILPAKLVGINDRVEIFANAKGLHLVLLCSQVTVGNNPQFGPAV